MTGTQGQGDSVQGRTAHGPGGAMLRPIRPITVAEAVYEQLRDAIVSGQFGPGSELPGERELSATMGANRGAVREALKRLEQSKLVTIHQGGNTRVCNYRRTATLGFLSELGAASAGSSDSISEDVAELCKLMWPEVASVAAQRGGPDLAQQLLSITARIGDPGSRTPGEHRRDYWALLGESTGNVAYELVLNTISEVIDPENVAACPVERDVDSSILERLAKSIEARDATAARQIAREWAEAAI